MGRQQVFSVAAVLIFATTAHGFSQQGLLGAATPSGHEYLTVMGANIAGLPRTSDWSRFERANKWVFDALKELGITDFRPMFRWKANLANERREASAYGTANLSVYSAIVGQRWVDLMGFPVTRPAPLAKSYVWEVTYRQCFDKVPQEPNDIMPDHFMRRNEDVGHRGRNAVIAEAKRRFQKYFEAAVSAEDELIPVWDCSGSCVAVLVHKPFFLLGRAIHLLQDSFSGEHTIRDRADGYQSVIEVKHYGCLGGTYQHTHANPLAVSYSTHDDVIFNCVYPSPVCGGKKDLKPFARAAGYATSELFRAFEAARTGGGLTEFEKIVNKWMKPSTKRMPPPTSERDFPAECKTKTLEKFHEEAAEIERVRDICLRGTGILSDEDPKKPPFFYLWGKPDLDLAGKLAARRPKK